MKTTFESTGTYPTPGPIGRSIRLVAGLVILYITYTNPWAHRDAILRVGWDAALLGWLPALAVGLYLLPVIIDRGFTLQWGRRSPIGLAILAGGTAVYDYLAYGHVWGPPLGWLTVLTLVLVFGHLGLSFLVAGLFATPG